jgi:hypothetical protein
MTRFTNRHHRPFALAALGLVAIAALASCEAGWVNPYAGSGSAGTTTDTVPAAQARFTDPTGVVANPGGGFYVYDAGTCTIYRESDGQVSVYAGTPGTCGDSGDGVQATTATLDNTMSVDTDARTAVHGPGHDTSTPMTLGPDGSLYFAEVTVTSWQTLPPDIVFPLYRSQVRRIAPDGTISAVGDGISGSATNVITGLTTTPDGTVLVAVAEAPSGPTHIDVISPDGTESVVTTTAKPVYAIAAISNTQIATLTTSSLDRVDLTTGAVTPTGQTATLGESLAAAPDGTIYVGLTSSNFIIRISPDDSPTVIAGTGSADPGTTAQSGDGQQLSLTPTGLALTPNDGLLISSGHVVYRLQDPANVPPLELGSPLNFFGGGCGPFTAVTGPSSPTSAPASTSCP